jgi:hydrogenase nickel incorporation protein HypA/HybF
MHELPIISSILKIVLAEAEKNNSKKVVAIHLRVGVFSDLQDEWMQRYFDYVSKDTIAEGATLKIERVPAMMKCAACSHEFKVTLNDLDGLQCPKCYEKKMNLISGREYYIEGMEVI